MILSSWVRPPVGTFHAGSANNIIPEEARLGLNLRWFSEDVKDKLINGIKSVTDHVATGFGVTKKNLPEYKILGGALPVINDNSFAEKAKKAMIKSLGEKNVRDGDVVKMASEDFHLLAPKVVTQKSSGLKSAQVAKILKKKLKKEPLRPLIIIPNLK